MDFSIDPIASNSRPIQRAAINPIQASRKLVDPTALTTDRDPRERAGQYHKTNSDHQNSETDPLNSQSTDSPSDGSIDFLT